MLSFSNVWKRISLSFSYNLMGIGVIQMVYLFEAANTVVWLERKQQLPKPACDFAEQTQIDNRGPIGQKSGAEDEIIPLTVVKL